MFIIVADIAVSLYSSLSVMESVSRFHLVFVFELAIIIVFSRPKRVTSVFHFFQMVLPLDIVLQLGLIGKLWPR